jgi:hypothetical protein
MSVDIQHCHISKCSRTKCPLGVKLSQGMSVSVESAPPIIILRASAVCRSRPPTMCCSVSPLEKSPVHFGRNSENSDLVVSTNNYLTKADTQDLIASGRDVPEADSVAWKWESIFGQERTPIIDLISGAIYFVLFFRCLIGANLKVVHN